LCAFEATQARPATAKATHDFIAFGDTFLDNIVQVRKGLPGHEKKSLQAIYAIQRDERTPVSYGRGANLIGHTEVTLIDELVEVAAS
jgi:hypothetical protein